jgi:hypothetical protein
MLLSLALFALGNVCSVLDGYDFAGPRAVEMQGVLYFTYHSANLVEPGHGIGKSKCVVFTVFSGTPEGMVSGFEKVPIRTDSKLVEFVREYSAWLGGKNAPLMAKVRGRLVGRKDFKAANGRGNGLGYHGLDRFAIFVDEISVLGPKPSGWIPSTSQ